MKDSRSRISPSALHRTAKPTHVRVVLVLFRSWGDAQCVASGFNYRVDIPQTLDYRRRDRQLAMSLQSGSQATLARPSAIEG
jgi:hypothetical protein